MSKDKPFHLSFFSSLMSTEPKGCTFERIFDAIKGNELKAPSEEYRRLGTLLAVAPAEEAKAIKQKMSAIKHATPAFIPSVELSGGRSGKCVRGFTGDVMVDIDHIPAEKFAKAERALKSDPHTVLCYTTLSGCGLRVIGRVSVPVTAETFPEAWRSVNEYFASVADVAFDRQCSNPTRMSCLSYDPTVVYNPDALPLDIKPAPKKKAKGRPPKNDAQKVGRIVRANVEHDGGMYVPGKRNDYVSRCIYLMNRYGIREEQTLEWALGEFADYNAGNNNSVPGIVASIYRNHRDEYASDPVPASCKKTSGNRASVEEIGMWLHGKFTIRRNTITQYVEVWRIGSEGGYAELDDVLENTIWCEMQRDGLNVEMQTLRAILRSDFVQVYNPLLRYLDSLPAWDGETDHIGEFLKMVHCLSVSPEQFDFYVRRWLVAMIAAVADDKVVNHEILVLLGKQGTYKTSFVNSILPPCLSRYYTVKTNAQRMTKDDVLALTENILINLEEIDSMTRSEVNQLKAMASLPYVCERPPYGRNKVRLPHIASFCATGNNLQFLTDTTGNRRWLVFEIDHIDNPRTTVINYDGIYAQLKYLYESGFKYWFDGSDIAALNEANKRFEAPNMERELIATHYRKPGPYEQCLYLSSSQIVARFSPQLRLSAVNVGRVMAELGFEMVRSTNGRFWKVYEIPYSDIGQSVPSEDLTNNDAPF